MFERFTDRARRVIVLAQEEARQFNHNYLGTEHILLGLIREHDGIAAQALTALGISRDAVHDQVAVIIGHGQQSPSGHIPFTPRAKKVIELSIREGLQLGHNYVGTEHVLLGLIREGEGVAAQILVKLGAELTAARQKIIELLSGYKGREEPETSHVRQLLSNELQTLSSKIAATKQELTRLQAARDEVVAHLQRETTKATIKVTLKEPEEGPRDVE